MQASRTIQTAFRFKPELLEKMKLRARREGISLNSLVEMTMAKELSDDEKDRYAEVFREIAKIKRPKVVTNRFDELSKYKSVYTEEDLADERTAYILSK